MALPEDLDARYPFYAGPRVESTLVFQGLGYVSDPRDPGTTHFKTRTDAFEHVAFMKVQDPSLLVVGASAMQAPQNDLNVPDVFRVPLDPAPWLVLVKVTSSLFKYNSWQPPPTALFDVYSLFCKKTHPFLPVGQVVESSPLARRVLSEQVKHADRIFFCGWDGESHGDRYADHAQTHFHL